MCNLVDKQFCYLGKRCPFALHRTVMKQYKLLMAQSIHFILHAQGKIFRTFINIEVNQVNELTWKAMPDTLLFAVKLVQSPF